VSRLEQILVAALVHLIALLFAAVVIAQLWQAAAR
jgi:hypothetical protein